MFQNFSGSSRRPRQVNLSGQNLDPFAATSWAPEASGTKKTLAVAQQEREKRQHERDRLNAAKRVQRVWRGHRVRKAIAESQRAAWDNLECKRGGDGSVLDLAEQSRLLVAFFDSSKPDDQKRLDRLAESLLTVSVHDIKLRAAIEQYQSRLANTVLDSFCGVSDTHEVALDSRLELLTALYIPSKRSKRQLISYYETLGTLLKQASSGTRPTALWKAIAAPLGVVESANGSEGNLTAYFALAFTILCREDLSQDTDLIQRLAFNIDVLTLSEAVLQHESVVVIGTMDRERRLWLLSHFIYLHNLRSKHNQEPTYIKALSIILSCSANDIFGRIEISREDASEGDGDTRRRLQPLPEFISTQVVSLVNKDSIVGLLAKFDADYSGTRTNGTEGDASLLASYALTLLRTFPTLGEEIRMWLYQSSVSLSTRSQVPAVKLFWKIMRRTHIFEAISSDSRAALRILQETSRKSVDGRSSSAELSRDRDWRAILLFLELYSFALRFTDDEEFISGGQPNVQDPHAYMSRSRESSLPLDDVRLLTVFLKNLSFTMYYNAADLVQSGYEESKVNLSSLFSTSERKQIQSPDSVASEGPKTTSEDFLGISGLTYDYVRNIVNRVMQMIYERDSRRRFLPQDHWLMTTKFDMAGFIPAVVAEEERRRQIADAEDEEPEEIDPVVSHSRQSISMQGMRQRASARAVAMIGPRLEILQHMPYVIPFKTRVQIFRQFTYQDKVRRRYGSDNPDLWRMRNHQFHDDLLASHHAKVRRESILKDAFDQFYNLGDGLKEPIQITFVDKFGNKEAGIDGGGVTKEFLTTITREAFATAEGGAMFVANDQNLVYPNPATIDVHKHLLKATGITEDKAEWSEEISILLKIYEFMGRIVGKCLYEGILVDIGFAGFFLLKWALAANIGSGAESRYQANINDLRDLDESLYQGLLRLKNHPGNVEDFGLDFTIDDVVSLPENPVETITRELLPNGANTPVTNENRVLYISLVARHRLHTQQRLQTNAFLRGLGDIIQPSWLSMFNQIELQTLVSGDLAEIDVEDLRRNTHYSGVYALGDDGLEHFSVRYFWEVMHELSSKDKGAVLKYVTSTPRAPLLGFSALNPPFTIRDSTGDQNRLPSASTCINLLKLPRYDDKETLKEKLLYAVNAGAGFDLS